MCSAELSEVGESSPSINHTHLSVGFVHMYLGGVPTHAVSAVYEHVCIGVTYSLTYVRISVDIS